jgi:hypothetical protein
MFGDLLAGSLIGVGVLMIVMGLAGSYVQLEQFGVKLPGAPDQSGTPETKQSVSPQTTLGPPLEFV